MAEVSSTVIRAEANKFAHEQVASQQSQFRDFGVMSGWTTETTYRTLGEPYSSSRKFRVTSHVVILDHEYEMRQLRIFQDMVARGLIFRHYRPVHYSPSSRSALAEAELEYKDAHISHAVHVVFDLDLDDLVGSDRHELRALLKASGTSKAKLLVWTTTPWTLTANMAIAVNPEMHYIAMRASSRVEDGVVLFAAERKDDLASLLEAQGLDEKVGEIRGTSRSPQPQNGLSLTTHTRI